LARPGKDWTAFKDSFWRGGINQTGGAYEVCSLCGGLLPGYSGDDYTVKLLGVQVKNIHPTWNGYGVAFRADYGKNGLSGYMVEMEKLNKNAPVVLYFSKWVDGKQIKPPLASVNMPAGYDINNPQNLGVKVEGDRFTAFLDGKQVLMTSDPTFTSGSAGVYSNHGTLLTFGGLDVDSVACNTFE
jgi:hypothetical protein